MAVTLAVTWKARPGSEARISEILRTMVGLTNQEPGCLHYSAHRSKDDPRDFLLFEQYRDDAAFDAHQAADYFQRYVIGEALPLLEERVRRFYEPVQ